MELSRTNYGTADLQTRPLHEAFDEDKTGKLSANQLMRKHLAEFQERQPQEDPVEVEDEFLSTRQLLKKHSTARKFDLTSSVKDTARSRRLNWDYQIKSLTTSLDELEARIKDIAKQSSPDPRDFQLLRNGFWPHCENAECLKSQILKVKVESEGGEHGMEAQGD